jgi:hypothetical protein
MLVFAFSGIPDLLRNSISQGSWFQFPDTALEFGSGADDTPDAGVEMLGRQASAGIVVTSAR